MHHDPFSLRAGEKKMSLHLMKVDNLTVNFTIMERRVEEDGFQGYGTHFSNVVLLCHQQLSGTRLAYIDANAYAR